MYVVMRTYPGEAGKKLVDLIHEHRSEVEGLLRAVPGFVSYTAAKMGNDGVSITVCSDKAGTDASMKIAREWVGKKAGSLTVSTPQVSEGEALVSF